MTINRALLAAGLASGLLAAMPAHAVNLVTNGTFTNPAAYSSDYSYCGSGPYACAPSTSGYAYFATNASNVNGTFLGVTDHTGDGGYLLVLDPSGPAGAFFTETFAIAQNATYTLSFFASQLNFGSSVVASVNGTTLGTFTPGSGWTEFTATFESGSASLATLRLDSGSGAIFFNDFAVDDVSFNGPAAPAGVPEPATWAFMILGFGTVGGALLRRRAVAMALA